MSWPIAGLGGNRVGGVPCPISPLTKSLKGAWRLQRGLNAPWGYAARRPIMLADDQTAEKPSRARAIFFFLSAPQSYVMASGHTRSRVGPSTHPSWAYLSRAPDPYSASAFFLSNSRPASCSCALNFVRYRRRGSCRLMTQSPSQIPATDTYSLRYQTK